MKLRNVERSKIVKRSTGKSADKKNEMSKFWVSQHGLRNSEEA